MKFDKISFYALLLLSLFSGYLLVTNWSVKSGVIEASGRVLRWEGDYAIIKFASETKDSIVVKTKVPYTKDRRVLESYDVVPVKYNPIAPAKLEIDGVIGNSMAGITFIFCFFIVGLLFASINLFRKSPS